MSRVSESELRARRAAQISRRPNRVSDVVGSSITFETARRPQLWCFFFARTTTGNLFKHGVGIHNRAFKMMHLLESYYLKQAGHCLSVPRGSESSIPPSSTFSEEKLSAIFRHSRSQCSTHSVEWANVVVLETLRTGGMVLTRIVENE